LPKESAGIMRPVALMNRARCFEVARVLTLAAGLFVAACAAKPPYVWVTEVPAEAAAGQELRAGDKVQVIVYGQDSMSGEFELRASGDLVVPVAGSVRAVGLTPAALAQQITRQLTGKLVTPQVTVVLASRRQPGVSVIGEVRTPGRFELREGEGMLDALARAGGLTPFADADDVYLIRRGQERRIRFRYADLVAASPASVRFPLMDGDVVVVE
jgi:polysaccharide biosynthesis/export protein